MGGQDEDHVANQGTFYIINTLVEDGDDHQAIQIVKTSNDLLVHNVYFFECNKHYNCLVLGYNARYNKAFLITLSYNVATQNWFKSAHQNMEPYYRYNDPSTGFCLPAFRSAAFFSNGNAIEAIFILSGT